MQPHFYPNNSTGNRHPPIRRNNNRCEQVDTHELLKKEMLRQGGEQDTSFRFGLNTSTPLGSGVEAGGGGGGNPVVGFEDTELYFDSLYKADSNSDSANGVISFGVTTLNNNLPLSNVIQIHIGEFYFPRLQNPRAQLDSVNYASLPLVPNSPDYFFYRRLYIQVNNLPYAQAVKTFNNQAYHWEMQVDELNSNAVRLIPIKKSFFLPRPITSLSEIVLRFLVPQSFTGVPFPVSLLEEKVEIRTYFTGGVGTNPMRFKITTAPDGSEALNLFNPPAIKQNKSPPDFAQIPLPALPAPGVAVFIQGFVGTNGGTPNVRLQNLINSRTGLFITNVVNIAAPSADPDYVFEIADADGSAINGPRDLAILNGLGTNVATMIIAQRRIAIPIRFTGVRDKLTNYISVFHN